jgi:hypothetical protein
MIARVVIDTYQFHFRSSLHATCYNAAGAGDEEAFVVANDDDDISLYYFSYYAFDDDNWTLELRPKTFSSGVAAVVDLSPS